MPSPFNQYLTHLGNLISITDDDRRIYAIDFEKIRDYIFDIMRDEDEVFDQICKGPSLFGSKANNVRILAPDEYDVHIKISFPHSELIKIRPDSTRPGFVRFSFTELLVKYEKSGCYEDILERLYKLVDFSNGLLRRSDFQRWMHKLIQSGLKRNGYYVIGQQGDRYYLEYGRRGLALNIYARSNARNISIDFVPAMVFGPRAWMQVPKSNIHYPYAKNCHEWFAVPKPTPGGKNTRRYAYMICNPLVEHDLILGRQNLKVVLRILKSMSKSYGLYRLKSYFIMTAFLWEVERQHPNFWRSDLEQIFIHMLGRLCDYFEDQNLPFFWDPNLNLLTVLPIEEIVEYEDKLISAYNTLSSYPAQERLSWNRFLQHFWIRK